LIFVLAGRLERKVYGLELYEGGFAPRLIISVGRYEVRQTAQLGFEDLKLSELTARTAPSLRHFFIELTPGCRRVYLPGLTHKGTYPELQSLGQQLQDKKPGSLILISTSIHLRRVQWCCRKIEALKNWRIYYIPVPEEQSPIHRDEWWKRFNHWSYLNAEWIKLIAYLLIYRN
jgi:hypothetical protein